MTGQAGLRGEGVRSDVWVSVELEKSGGIQLDVKSKVEAMYGESIRALAREGLEFFGVKHAKVQVEDRGALPFVIMARLEAAVRRAKPGQAVKEWLPEAGPTFARPSARDHWRRSRLYLPGNEARFMVNARIHGADAVILDLEDSVPPEEKDAALVLVRNALRVVDFGDCERMVRVNQLPRGLDELDTLVRAGANLILVPKCEVEDDIKELDRRLKQASTEVWLMPIIETAQGMFEAARIARASERVAALTWGMEDYLADTGASKTQAGLETVWARSQVVNAARAAGVQPIDTVYGNVDDLEGLAASCRVAREFGFEGKGCVHPRQIPVVNEAFTPSVDEVEQARKVVLAYRKARAQGHGAVAVGSKMVDAPVVKRCLRTVELAEKLGRLVSGWDKESA